MKNLNIIDRFEDEFAFLSNFYIHTQIHDGKEYDSNEHWYQANKSSIEEEREAIRLARTPGIAKRMGSKKGYKKFKITLREDWENAKIDIMMEGLMNKFSNPFLKKKLLNTYLLMLIEGNRWHDNYWGSCTCNKCKKKFKRNALGHLLMAVRERKLIEVSKKKEKKDAS